MDIHKDGAGNPYIDVANVRITLVSNQQRDADWTGGEYRHCIRIQAYRGGESRSLHMGAEIPLNSQSDAFSFVAAFSYILAERMPDFTQIEQAS